MFVVGIKNVCRVKRQNLAGRLIRLKGVVLLDLAITSLVSHARKH